MQTLSRKNKINLADYPYRRDIENRLLLAQLTDFEVNLLHEIIHHSLKISIDTLAEEMDADIDDLNKALDKLSGTKLFKKDHATILVNKEMRKYYESQIEKFDEDFEPDMEYLQTLLSKVPIHALPLWYAIPRSSDNIFSSIFEKYLQTPEIYRQYMEDLRFDDPVVSKIIKDLYQAPDFKIASSVLIEKYKLSKEEFEELMLLLEYHFICCIKYDHIDGVWHESVSFFQEWLDYMTFEKLAKPSPIPDPKAIKSTLPLKEFAFINDMQTILQACNHQRLNSKDAKKLLDRSGEYVENLIAKLTQLDFVTGTQTGLRLTDKGALWLAKSLPERSAYMANSHSYELSTVSCPSSLQMPRNIRLIENSLIKRTTRQEWYLLEDFVKGFMGSIGDKEPIKLSNKGKKWKYTLPKYSEEEQEFIRAIIMERFLELGIVDTGTYKGKPCFSVTPFGRIALH